MLPAAEFFNGRLHPAAEHQGRVDAILAAIGSTEASPTMAIEPILRVHGGDYVDFLRTAFEHGARRVAKATPFPTPSRSSAGGRSTSTASTRAWPVQLRHLDADRRGHLGRLLLDACRRRWPRSKPCSAASAPPSPSPGRPGTMPAAIISAAIPISTTPRSAPRRRWPRASGGRDPRRRLSPRQRHPGHFRRPRATCVFASIHADPAIDYPFFWGHADESERQHPQPAAAARHRLGRLRARACPGARLDRGSGGPSC